MANSHGVADADGGLMALLGGAQSGDLFNFNPVCPASDGVFRLGQRTAVALAGDQNVDDYRPLINDVLIRVRTELCVLESFMRETALPFIQKKGVGWILPVHETSETYVAGVVFVVGANFILLGSTKILAILSIYHDILLGLPSRAFGGFLEFAARGGVPRDADEKKLKQLLDKQFTEVKKAMERSDGSAKVSEISERYAREIEALQESQAKAKARRQEKGIGQAQQVAAGISVPLRVYGQLSLGLKTVLEAFDTFCSRYLVATTVLYAIFKSVHFWVLPDFP
uniref:Uncharacterized protein n=1 Tax=Lotharella oceanica TaxID=641309 RepID=A0A7S2XAP8_9EUKA